MIKIKIFDWKAAWTSVGGYEVVVVYAADAGAAAIKIVIKIMIKIVIKMKIEMKKEVKEGANEGD